ncbi:MAG: hypothetical protein ACE3JK_15125 [Sporolactobacillus sp.]
MKRAYKNMIIYVFILLAVVSVTKWLTSPNNVVEPMAFSIFQQHLAKGMSKN